MLQKALRITCRADLMDLPTIAHQLLLFGSSGLMAEALLVCLRHSEACSF